MKKILIKRGAGFLRKLEDKTEKYSAIWHGNNWREADLHQVAGSAEQFDIELCKEFVPLAREIKRINKNAYVVGIISSEKQKPQDADLCAEYDEFIDTSITASPAKRTKKAKEADEQETV